MKAAVLRAFGKPLSIEHIDPPAITEGEVLVRVRAVGICGTDVKICSGAIPGIQTPLIPGHEVAGELVEAHGDLPAGQRVAAYIFQPCGVCPPCLRKQDTLCIRSPRLGFERDGGLAEFIRMRPQDLIPFGEDLPFAKAAVAMDAVLSPWHALKSRAGLTRGDTVVIVGAGGLGLHAVMIARAAGAHVGIVDLDEDHRHAAQQLGAEIAVHPDEFNVLLEWAGAGADIALESSGAPAGFQLASRSVRLGGTVVCCGYKPGADYPIDSLPLAMRELNILGSRGGTLTDAVSALRAVEDGSVDPIIVGVGQLSDANRFLETLAKGQAVGRLVVEL